MDQLGQKLDFVSISSLPTWDHSWDKIPAYNVSMDEFRTSRCPFDPMLNQKIVLWEGDPISLDAMGLVHPTNEHLNEVNSLSDAIHKRAGPDLQLELYKKVKCCRTGEAKLSKGYNLPARFLIHTVGPRYNIRYRTAAESALFNCYSNVLQIARYHLLLGGENQLQFNVLLKDISTMIHWLGSSPHSEASNVSPTMQPLPGLEFHS